MAQVPVGPVEEGPEVVHHGELGPGRRSNPVLAHSRTVACGSAVNTGEWVPITTCAPGLHQPAAGR